MRARGKLPFFTTVAEGVSAVLTGGPVLPQPTPSWQPIETAPRDGSWFATFSPGEGFATAYDLAFFDVASGTFCKICCGFQYATHWLPLGRPLAATGDSHG